MKFPAESILVIRMSGIGDVLWTTPLLANLRMAYPDAHIAYVVRSASAFVLENNPHVDELLLFEREELWWQLGFLRRLYRRHFDLSVDLICSPATAIQSVVSGAHTRVGFDFRIREKLYNHRLSASESNVGHEVEFNLAVLPYMEIPIRTRSLVWRVSDSERTHAETIWHRLGLGDRETVIGLVPTGGFPSKKWPIDHWRSLTNVPALADMRFLVFCGSEQERRDAESIARGSAGRIVVEPKGTLRDSAALMQRCTGVVGNDSGPMHIATAFDIPVVALYGPTNPRSQGPWSDRAIVLRIDDVETRCCRRLDCPDPVCMTEIMPARVANALRELLDRSTQHVAGGND